MKVLITGISGFVGSNFVSAWQKDFVLYGLSVSYQEIDGVEKIFLWDQLDEIPAVDAIIHLAGKAHDTKNKIHADEYFTANTALTKTIFDYFLQSGVKKFIYFSSVKAIADTVEGEVLTEDVTPKPIGPYGESKLKAEEYILSYKEAAELKNKKAYIVRPCMIHGPGNKGNLNLLYQFVRKGIPYPLGSYNNERSFLSIKNLIFLIEGILKDDIASGIYNAADDEFISTNQLIEFISKSSGKKSKLWYLPKFILQSVAAIGDILRLPLNSERLKKLTENYRVSNTKIKKALNINKLPLTAEEGITKTIQTFINKK